MLIREARIRMKAIFHLDLKTKRIWIEPRTKLARIQDPGSQWSTVGDDNIGNVSMARKATSAAQNGGLIGTLNLTRRFTTVGSRHRLDLHAQVVPLKHVPCKYIFIVNFGLYRRRRRGQKTLANAV